VDLSALHASLFGSTARGDGDTQSDVDLVVIRPAAVDEEDPTWREQLDRLAQRVESWTGNHSAIIELGEMELSHPSPALRDVRAEGIDLAGTPIRSLFGDRR
jgi:predicted nucleotidyltransferase